MTSLDDPIGREARRLLEFINEHGGRVSDLQLVQEFGSKWSDYVTRLETSGLVERNGVVIKATGKAPVAEQIPERPSETSNTALYEGETEAQQLRSFIQRWRDALCFSEMDSTAKHVGTTLSFSAGEDGDAWPSVATLARKTSHTRKTVSGSLTRLEHASWLMIDWTRGGDPGATHHYKFLVPTPVAATQVELRTPGAGTGVPLPYPSKSYSGNPPTRVIDAPTRVAATHEELREELFVEERRAGEMASAPEGAHSKTSPKVLASLTPSHGRPHRAPQAAGGRCQKSEDGRDGSRVPA